MAATTKEKKEPKSKDIENVKHVTSAVVDVTVHPLVLLSAADHYHRVARGTRKRAVGVLLGTVSRGRVDVLNSFAVPFEEDLKNPVSRTCTIHRFWDMRVDSPSFLLHG